MYRAELIVVNRTVRAANQATHTVPDCLSVVNIARAIFYGNHTNDVGGEHADLWRKTSDKVKTSPENFYRITLIPSQKGLAQAVENEANGGHRMSMILGNAHADREAKAAMVAHAINWDEYADADDRVYLAALIQHMIMTIWERLFIEETQVKDECGLDPTHPNPYTMGNVNTRTTSCQTCCQNSHQKWRRTLGKRSKRPPTGSKRRALVIYG